MHMTVSDTTHLLRRILELGFVLWANIVFRGVVLGGTLLFLRNFFEPLLMQHLEGIAKLDIADWLYFVVGIATVVLWSGIRGKPLLRDANREQFEAMEYVVRNLPEQEQRQIYRRIARKMVDQFRLDSDVEFNLRLEAEKAVAEEENS
jgi:hypothetical protein